METEMARQAAEGAAIRAAMRTNGKLHTNNRLQLITSIADDHIKTMSAGADGSAFVAAARAKKSSPRRDEPHVQHDDAMRAGADGSDFLAAIRAKRAK